MRFGSITLNDREAHMSQPKRELFGLLRVLEAVSYWLLGIHNLIVETDVKYLAEMLRRLLQLMVCLEELPTLVMRFSQTQKKI